MDNETQIKLANLRANIDQCNHDLLDILKQRCQYVLQVGELKSKQRAESTAFYTPEREAYILEDLRKYNKKIKGNFSNVAIEAIFREVISASLALEKSINIGYMGPSGSYTHIATKKNFGSSAEYTSFADIESVFIAVAQKQVDCAVVPIENSTAGIVGQTISALDTVATSINICGELSMNIHHALISKNPQIDLSNVTEVRAHEQALSQCKNWIASNLPKAIQNPTSSNSRAAEMLATTANENTVVIAHPNVAKIYNLHIQKTKIEDQSNNTTRFFVLRHKDFKSSIAANSDIGKSITYKSSMLIYAKNNTGLLANLLQPLKTHNVDCINLHSYPSKNSAWSYFFYVEFIGHHEHQNVKAMLKSLEEMTEKVCFLGSYPLV